jgi:ribonuclease HI|tara:strand:- start:6394 stop:6789 length:396 start_codon:yes stop_codon:yes gene_type:complete
VIEIYTDGACLNNPGPGGWGVIILEKDKKTVFGGSEKTTTNNRMEITAVIEGLKQISKKTPVKIFSDSTYVINTMTKNWKRNKNKDLWDILDDQVLNRKIEWKWVKGHSGDKFNEEADSIAYGEAVKIQKK